MRYYTTIGDQTDLAICFTDHGGHTVTIKIDLRQGAQMRFNISLMYIQYFYLFKLNLKFLNIKENIISISITLNKYTNTYFMLQFKLTVQFKLSICRQN